MKHNSIWYCSVVLVFLPQVVKAELVRNVCGTSGEALSPVQSAAPANNIVNYQRVICDLRTRDDSAPFAASLAIIQRLAQNYQRAVAEADRAPAIEGDEPTPAQQAAHAQAESLNRLLDNVIDRMNERAGLNSYNPPRQTALSNALQGLLTNFASVEQRRASEQNYYQALRNALSLTSQGPELISCFERLNDDSVSGFKIELFDSTEEGMAETSGTFSVVRSTTDPSKFEKVMRLNVDSSPTAMVRTLAHELQHSCNYVAFRENVIRAEAAAAQSEAIEQEMVALVARLESLNLPEGSEAPPEIVEQLTQLNDRREAIESPVLESGMHASAIDELRAYRLDAQVFAELAATHPAYFCDYTVLNLSTGRLERGGDVSARQEKDIEDGRFIHELIETYTRINGYDPQAFYQFENFLPRIGANGLPVLREDFRQQMLQSGFNAI